MIDLKPFCSFDEGRFAIEQPFSFGDFTYATDGRLILRVARRDDVPEEPKAPKPEFLWNSLIKAVNFQPLPPIPEPVWENCEDCEGSGVQECGNCACPECEAGKFLVTTTTPIGGRKFQDKFLRKIATLPNVQVSTDFGTETEAMQFTFDGGCGLLCPMKQTK